MKYYYIIFLSILFLSGCSEHIYSTARNTPYAIYEEQAHRIDIAIPTVDAHDSIILYKPSLYYTRPTSILFVNNTQFVDEFEEETLVVSVPLHDPLLQYNRRYVLTKGANTI